MPFQSKSVSLFVFLIAFYATADEVDNLFDLSLEELMEVKVVTAASGFEQKVTQAPATVTVVTHKEWQARGARSLSDVLMSIPGVHVGKPQGDFMHHKFFIRGLSGTSSTQIKLLIDGEPFEWMQSNSLPVGFRMPLTAFERVEVVKGPGSVVYGADAFAGVINLVTFKHGMTKEVVGARLGSFNTHDFYARKSFDFGDSNIQWALDYTQSDDDPNRVVSSDLQSIFDSIFGTTVSQAPGAIDEHYEVLTFLAKWQWNKVNLSYLTWRNFDMGIGAGAAQALIPDGKGSSYINHLNLDYDLSDIVTGKLKATFSYKNQRTRLWMKVFPSGSVLPIGQDGNLNFQIPSILTTFEDGFIGTPSPGGNTKTFRLEHLLNPTPNNLLRWELGYEKQQFLPEESKNFGPGILDGSQSVVDGQLTNVTDTPFLYIPKKSRKFYYLSVQNEWKPEDYIQITMGIRYDRYSDFGSTTNPRIGINWLYSDKITLKAFAGTAYRAPSFFQLYGSNNPVNIGNSSLKPETIDTIETGFNVEYLINNDFVISANYFNYHAKDLIDFVFEDALQGNVANNVGEQDGHGGEVWIKWKPTDNIFVDFNYSYISAKDDRKRVIIDIPQNMLYLQLNWLLDEHWAWNIDAKWIGNRERAHTDSRENIANYVYASTKLEYKDIIPGLDASLIVTNFFNDDIREPSNGNISEDYPLAGRAALFELNYSF